MCLDAEALLEPRLQLRIAGFDPIGHDADRRPAVDFFQTLKDRAEVVFVGGRAAHIVDRQHDRRFDTRLADPLRRDQFRRVQADAVRVTEFVEVSQPIAVASQQSIIARFYRISQSNPWLAPTFIVGVVICIGMLINAMTKLGGRTTTTWRGTTYRGDQLASTDTES